MKKFITPLLLLLLSIPPLYAQLAGWSYKNNVYLLNHDAATYSNVQAAMIINTASLVSAGKMKADGSDLRFMDGSETSQLSYWIESGMNTASTKVWVKVPDMAPSVRTHIVMFYGNPAATAVSSGDSTFVFFDDFNNLDSSKWSSYVDGGVSLATGNGKFTYTGSGYANLISKNMGITAPFIVHTNVNGFSAYSWDLGVVGYAKDDNSFTRVNFFSGVALRVGSGVSDVGFPVTVESSTSVTSTSCTSNYEFVSKVASDGGCEITYPSGSASVPASLGNLANATRISLGYFYNPSNATGVCSGGRIYDNIFVRKNVLTDVSVDSSGIEGLVRIDSLSLDPDTLTFADTAGSQSVNLASNTGWTIDPIDSPASLWLSVSALSGSNNSLLGVMALANMAGVSRTAIITVRAGSVTKTIWVSQSAHFDSLSLDPDTLTFLDFADSETINVHSNTSWVIDTPSVSWLTVSTLSGSHDAAIGVSVSANTTGFTRSTTLAVKTGALTRTIFVIQAPHLDSLSLNPDTLIFMDVAGSKTVNLYSNTSWTIDTPSVSWLTVSTLSGSHDAAVAISALANATGAARFATLMVKAGILTRTIFVIQAPHLDSLSLDPDTLNYSDTAGSKIVHLRSNASWSINNPVGWINISALSGSGDTTLLVTVQANTTGAPRMATLTVTAGSVTKTIMVSQDGNVGLQDLKKPLSIAVYPNPTTGIININGEQNEETATVTLFDLEGRALKSFTLFSGNTIQTDCSDLSNGIYLLQMRTEDKTKNVRMIIAK